MRVSPPARRGDHWWGLPDGGWLNAPTGLVRADGTPKPAFDALRGLIKGDWWLPPTRMVTDDEGRIRFSGFLGDYEVRSTDGAGEGAGAPAGAPGGAPRGTPTVFSLDRPGEQVLEVQLGA